MLILWQYQEHMLVCESSVKPLVFFHLVYNHAVTNALVFTKSAESTARLVRLFDFFDAARRTGVGGTPPAFVARAYSSDLSPTDRKSILEQFKAKEIQMYALRNDIYVFCLHVGFVALCARISSPVVSTSATFRMSLATMCR
jgi:hypothetical protein